MSVIRYKRWIASVSVLGAAVALASCGQGDDSGSPDEVHITIGTGLPYAPLTMVKASGELEKAFPDTKIVWDEGVSGGAATRDGMLANKVQVGVTGIAPYLIGLDKGVPWRVLSSMGQIGISLVATDPTITTLEELDKSGKPISAPSPDSGQALALKVLAEKELGRPDAFDDQLTPMPHPDAYQALTSGTIGAAFIAPPFQYQLVDDEGAHEIATAADAFGPITYSAIVMTDDFYKANPDFAEELHEELGDALAKLRDEPAAAAAVLAAADGNRVPAETYEKWLTLPQNTWDGTPVGFTESAEAMKEFGLIEKVPAASAMFFGEAEDGK